MRTYQEARRLVGAKVTASVTGGRVKRLRFEADGNAVKAVLIETAVVTFYPGHVEIRTNGWVTPTTFDGIATALLIARGDTWCGTRKRIPYVMGHRLTEGMWLSYEGALVRNGPDRTPLARPRKTVSPISLPSADAVRPTTLAFATP